MRKLLPFALVLCSGFSFPAIAHPCPRRPISPGLPRPISPGIPRPISPGLPRPDTTIYIQKDTSLNRPVVRLEWQLLLNGAIAQKGVIPLITLSSKHPTPVSIPAKFRSGNNEVFLRLIFRPVPAAHHPPLLTRVIPIRPWKGDYSIQPTGEMAFTDSGDLFTITSADAMFRFDKESGWLLHYETNHLILADDSGGFRPSIWPSSVTQPHLQLFSTSTGSQLVIVRTEYTLPEVSCLLHISYTINAAGEMLVSQSLEADSTHPDTTTRPALPSFGMNWLLLPGLDSVTCYAPLADTAAIPELFHASPAGIPPTPIRWISFTGANNKGIRIIADSSFLLLRPTGTQLHLLRAIPSLPIPFADYQYAFKISPILPPPSPANNHSTPSHAAIRSTSPH